MSEFLRTRVVTEAEYHAAHSKTGSIYFIRNSSEDTIKVGHSRDPSRRLQQLQVGNSARLTLIGVIAAEIAVEAIVHQQLREGHINGEWFWDREVTTAWLMNMTNGVPLYRNVWTLEDRQEKTWLHDWSDPQTPRRWNETTRQWEPDTKK